MLALLGAPTFGGCADGAVLLPPAVEDGRGSLAGLRLGTPRDETLAALNGRFAPPRCTSVRLAPATGSRRAFPMERCEHESLAPDAPSGLSGRGVERLVTGFVDGALVRIDVELGPSDASPGAALERLDARLGDRVDVPGEANGALVPVPRWTAGADRLWFPGGGGNARATLVLIDPAVVRVLPGIADDLPADDRTEAR